MYLVWVMLAFYGFFLWLFFYILDSFPLVFLLWLASALPSFTGGFSSDDCAGRRRTEPCPLLALELLNVLARDLAVGPRRCVELDLGRAAAGSRRFLLSPGRVVLHSLRPVRVSFAPVFLVSFTFVSIHRWMARFYLTTLALDCNVSHCLHGDLVLTSLTILDAFTELIHIFHAAIYNVGWFGIFLPTFSSLVTKTVIRKEICKKANVFATNFPINVRASGGEYIRRWRTFLTILTELFLSV